MSEERWIIIPRWDDLQHPDATRTGNIPWLKTFTRLLSDSSYLDLNAGERAVLHGIWLEYARARGQISVGTRSIQGRLKLDARSLSNRLSLRVTERQLETLNHAGFIEFSASRPASRPASSLQAQTREEKKERTSTSTEPSRAPARNPAPGAWKCPLCHSLTFGRQTELHDHLTDVHWLEGPELEQQLQEETP